MVVNPAIFSSLSPLAVPLLFKAARDAGRWCAAKFLLIWMAFFLDDQAAALGHATGLREAAAQRGPGPALADGLACQSGILAALGRYAEAAEVARQALAVARQIGYPLAEALPCSTCR